MRTVNIKNMSAKYKLDRADGAKILKGAIVAVLGALLTFLTDLLPRVELNEWSPLVMAVWSVVVNSALKFLMNLSPEKSDNLIN